MSHTYVAHCIFMTDDVDGGVDDGDGVDDGVDDVDDGDE